MWAVAAQPRTGLTPMIPTPSVDSGIATRRPPREQRLVPSSQPVCSCRSSLGACSDPFQCDIHLDPLPSRRSAEKLSSQLLQQCVYGCRNNNIPVRARGRKRAAAQAMEPTSPKAELAQQLGYPCQMVVIMLGHDER